MRGWGGGVKMCHSFLWDFFERTERMLLYQFDMIESIRLLEREEGFGFEAKTGLIPSKLIQTKVYFGFNSTDSDL